MKSGFSVADMKLEDLMMARPVGAQALSRPFGTAGKGGVPKGCTHRCAQLALSQPVSAFLSADGPTNQT